MWHSHLAHGCPIFWVGPVTLRCRPNELKMKFHATSRGSSGCGGGGPALLLIGSRLAARHGKEAPLAVIKLQRHPGNVKVGSSDRVNSVPIDSLTCPKCARRASLAPDGRFQCTSCRYRVKLAPPAPQPREIDERLTASSEDRFTSVHSSTPPGA